MTVYRYCNSVSLITVLLSASSRSLFHTVQEKIQREQRSSDRLEFGPPFVGVRCEQPDTGTSMKGPVLKLLTILKIMTSKKLSLRSSGLSAFARFINVVVVDDPAAAHPVQGDTERNHSRIFVRSMRIFDEHCDDARIP
jgi:hypothetical protein